LASIKHTPIAVLPQHPSSQDNQRIETFVIILCSFRRYFAAFLHHSHKMTHYDQGLGMQNPKGKRILVQNSLAKAHVVSASNNPQNPGFILLATLGWHIPYGCLLSKVSTTAWD